jgi:hypothetical protein
VQVHASAAVAAGDPAEAAKTPPKPWPGIKPVPLLLSAAVGLALRFLVPIPAGLTTQAWTLLSIFVSTIAGRRLSLMCLVYQIAKNGTVCCLSAGVNPANR